MEQFVTMLKNQANQCEFGDLKEELIKTMIIIGIGEEDVREKLLEKENTSLEQIVECCIVTENSRNKLKLMRDKMEARQQEVDFIHKRGQPFRNRYTGSREKHFQSRSNLVSNGKLKNENDKIIKNCNKCRKTHKINNCPAFTKICLHCKKLNHFAIVCRKKSKSINEISNEESDEVLCVDKIMSNKYNYCVVKLNINTGVDTNVTFKVDTGASTNIISFEDLCKIKFDNRNIKYCNDNLKTYTGQNIPIVGKCNLDLTFNNNHANQVEFHIVKGK